MPSPASAGAGFTVTQREPEDLPSYVRIINDTLQISVPDSVFYRIAGTTIFRVNRTELNMTNEFVNELSDKVFPLARAQGWTLVAMELRGAASPEGPYYNNVRLSKGRAAALRQYLEANIDSVSYNLTTSTVAEDYPYLLWLLERDGDGAAPILRSIMARHPDDPAAIKRELQRTAEGRVWARLLRDYFPKVRTARVVLFFTRVFPYYKPYELEIEPEPAPTARKVYFDPLQEDPLTRSEIFSIPLFRERPHLLSLSSNLLYDAFYMPHFGWAPMLNINAEFYPRKGNFTFRAGFTSPYYHKWDRHKFFQIRDYHLEVRRYFHPGTLHQGAYLAAYVNANKYGIGLGPTKGWEGEGYGGALKLGYVLPLGNGRCRLDFHAAVGGYITRFDPYVWGNPITGEYDGKYYYDYTGAISDFNKRSHRLKWFGPTEIGITLTFDVLYYRLIRNGASFIRKEVGL